MKYPINEHRIWQPGLMPCTILTTALLFSVFPDPAFAADNLFGGNSPLTRFIDFITGIFAYMLVIVGIVVTLGGLILGSDMSGFSRRAPLVVVSGAVLILADTLVGTLFSGTAGAEVPAALWPVVQEFVTIQGQPQ
ncbi:MAG: TrbC/VirB2 family protein [Aestuariivita sp.]|nr:TrbC/VirB2 family protein [Aestuariivita sp.]MCY4345395.1 TrbC/VirB2 family protein [Aestuariivita sp.]